jgi:hypothetical protein
MPRTLVQSETSTAPYLSASCPNLYVPFFARHFKRADVAWLNPRYWCAEGWDLSDKESVGELKKLIIDRFGVSAPGHFDSDDAYSETGVTLYADRYGGTFGHSHGGSGRAGTVGDFNAKGIGPTPLRYPKADWYHAHGCMWLEEAIREAIFSEVCWHEFPRKSNPIIAIIDTGEHIQWADGSRGARRAIVVRPAALRVSHLERNILFGTAGTVESDQYRDFLRVKEIVSHVRDCGIDRDTDPTTAILASIIDRICDQIGFGRAHRLFHGDYLSSNICISGTLIDFGAFRGVLDWRRQAWEPNGLPFGGEDRRLFQTARSLAFHLRKHIGASSDNLLMPLEDITAAINGSFVKSLESLCSGHPKSQSIVTRIVEYYEMEQQRSPSESSSWQSFQAGIGGEASDGSSAVGSAVHADVMNCRDKVVRDQIATRLTRWAASRSDSTREAVLGRTTSLISALEAADGTSGAAFSRRVSAFIDENICNLRRSFVALSEDETVLENDCAAGCLVLHCHALAARRDYWRIEGPSCDGMLLADGELIHPWAGCEQYDPGPGLTGYISPCDPSDHVGRQRTVDASN